MERRGLGPAFFLAGHRSVTCGDPRTDARYRSSFDSRQAVRPDQEFTDGVRLAAIAVVSAVVTAVLVIGAGRAVLPRLETRTNHPPALIPASMP